MSFIGDALYKLNKTWGDAYRYYEDQRNINESLMWSGQG